MNNLLVRVDSKAFSEDSLVTWIDAIEPRTYGTKRWGEVPITATKIDNFVKNFHDGVHSSEVIVDYEHGRDVAKGNKAAGGIRDARVNDGRLQVQVELTPTAKQEIAAGEWRYFSLEWEDDYEDTTTRKKAKDVMIGGGLTNKPVARGLRPINFSDIVASEPDSDVFIKELIDSAFEIMEPGSDNPDFENTQNDDGTGSRRDTPPPGYDGSIEDVPSTVEASAEQPGGDSQLDLLVELRKLYGLSDDVADADVLTHITKEHKEFSDLSDTSRRLADVKQFAEQFPVEAKRMADLEDANRTLSAKSFSDTLAGRRVTKNEGEGDNVSKVDTGLGFSALVIDAARDVHKKFSDGIATVEDFTGFVDTVLDNGVVEYGERGSRAPSATEGTEETDLPNNVTDIRKKFSDIVNVVLDRENKDKDEETRISFTTAVATAAKENPKLYELYRTVSPAA